MTTGQVDLALTFLLLLALVHRRGDWRIVGTLALAFIASSIVGPQTHGIDRQVALSVLDTVIVLLMLEPWTHDGDMRAYTVGFLGLAKLGSRLLYTSASYANHTLFAIMINCAFAAQVMVAGGFVDALGLWLDRNLRLFFPRRYKLLRDGAH
jgi:hypothetical protein